MPTPRKARTPARRILEIGGSEARTGLVVASPVLQRLLRRSKYDKLHYQSIATPTEEVVHLEGRKKMVVQNRDFTRFPYNVKRSSIHELHMHMVTIGLRPEQYGPWKNEVHRILVPGGRLYLTADANLMRSLREDTADEHFEMYGLENLFLQFRNDPRFRVRLFAASDEAVPLRANLDKLKPELVQRKKGLGLPGIRGNINSLRFLTKYPEFTQMVFIVEKRLENKHQRTMHTRQGE